MSPKFCLGKNSKIKVSGSKLEFLFQRTLGENGGNKEGVTLELGPHIVAGEAVRCAERRGRAANEEQIEVHVGRSRLCSGAVYECLECRVLWDRACWGGLRVVGAEDVRCRHS